MVENFVKRKDFKDLLMLTLMSYIPIREDFTCFNVELSELGQR